MALTDAKLRDAKFLGRRYKLSDAKGLGILVTSTAKLWRFRYRFGGKQKGLSVGIYPDVPLIDARQRRDEMRRLLARGIDPGVVRREEKARLAAERLAAKDSPIVQVSIALDGMVEIWKGRAMVRLTNHESYAVKDLLIKLYA